MVNRIQDAFHTIEANEDLKTSTMQFLKSERQKRTTHTVGPALYRIVTACVMLFLVIGISGYQILQTPVSYVSIDVNPSVELALNRFDRVVSSTAYNEDGEIVLSGLSVNGKKYMEAIDIIIESEAMSVYLTNEAELVFTIAANNDNKESQLRAGIANCAGCMKHGGQSLGVDIGIVAEAHENGLSMGKYSAYLQLVQYDDTITVDDCQRMTMSEIHGLINKHEQCEMNPNVDENGREYDDSSETHGSHNRHGMKKH